MKFLKVKKSKQHPHHNSNHWWLLKDREITRKNGEAFKVAVEDVLNDQRSFDLLDRKIVTREDGELFKKVIDYAIKEGYSYDLLWQKFVTRQDKELFDKVVKQAIKDHWSAALIKDKIITEEELELYKNKENKIEATIQQPNKPKPTTMLPDNMEWAWDPNAADWVAVLKDNTNTTPPLYDPNNQNVVNQTTSYMSNIKSASSEVVDKNGKKAEEGMWLYKPVVHNTFRGGIPLRLFQVKIRHQKDGIDKPYLLSENKLITKGISNIKDGILFDTYEEAKQYSESHKTKEEKEFDKLDDWQKTDYYLSKQSSCLSKFLDGSQYSKEIKIEAGLIKNGLVKYAGFDFNRGTKYTITTKGLEVLRRASEAEHNEALNEREKLAYMFGFNTDEVSTLDTTGKVIKQSAKKWTICESDGTELGEVEADSELDAKVKFGIEHPEYADSQSISAKEIDAKYEETTESHEPYPNPSETPHDDIVLENHDGWVNTAEQKVTPEFTKLHSILGKYRKQDKIQDIIQDGKDLLVTCSPATSFELKEQIESLGYECEETDESETGDVYTLPTFVLRIKMK